MGGRRWSAARGSAPPSLPARVPGRGAQPSRPPGRRAPAPSRGCPLSPAAPGSPAAPRLRPADPRVLRPEGTRGGGPGAGFLGSHFCAAARLGPLLPPAADPPRRERWRLGGRARHRQPLPGVGTTTHVFLSGASRTATQCRCAWQPSRVRGPRAGMPGPRAAAARGPRGEGSLAPSYPEEAAPGARRAAGTPHRHLFARLSPGARAALRVGPPPPGRVGGGPAPHPRLLLLLLLLLAREARAPAPRDSSPSPLRRAPWAVEGAGGSLCHRPSRDGVGRPAPPRRVLLADFSQSRGFSRVYPPQQLPPRDTLIPTATGKPVRATPRELRSRGAEVTLPSLRPPSSSSPTGRVVASPGDSADARGMGWGARCQDRERRPEAGLTPGPRCG